ncbi:MAG: right-handed parallel beta-helix repeat-containing protein, partial [Bacteroidota bacterium]|nr:right-handed parallel beta-helix repeat-containing protein [Bacteroidota bacterium]
FRIKRGVGSVQIPPNASYSGLSIDQHNFQLNISSMDFPPQILSGELTDDLLVPADSYIHIPADLTIPEGITMQIDSGSFVTVAPEVNIYNNGLVLLKGSARAPVTLTCNDYLAYWGGFIGNSTGNRIDARYTIFSRSGHHTGGEYAYGHAGRQALFYSENGELKLDHCYMIDHIGQVFYPVSCTLELTDCLVQRAKTGGQLNQSELVMDRCVFTDFPDDGFDYQDEDNDALYLDETNAVITNSVFMFARDDGLDSGASGGGEVTVKNSVFESVFHEGAALSSGHSAVKLHHFTNCLFSNCGQGLELGYSSPNHQVIADSCSFIGNGVGIRYGDCYDFPHHGYIHISNSQSLNNSYYDVWNMNREHWAADTLHMSFDHVLVSTPNPMYPELIHHE